MQRLSPVNLPVHSNHRVQRADASPISFRLQAALVLALKGRANNDTKPARAGLSPSRTVCCQFCIIASRSRRHPKPPAWAPTGTARTPDSAREPGSSCFQNPS